MRAILIDPKEQTVTEVDYNGDYKDINRLIDAEFFDIVRVGDRKGHTIFVDDNGLNNGKEQTVGSFRVEGEYPAYLAGRGLILATDREGESVAATMELDAVRAMVAFGEACRLNGKPVFVELQKDEELSPQVFWNNRFWAIDN